MAPSLRLVFDPTGDLLESSRQCEADIFLQWYGNTRQQLADEYGPYEQNSVFVALADDHDDVVGTVRFLVPEGGGLKTLDDMALAPWGVDARRSAAAAGVDLTNTWDCATMGVHPGVTGSQVRLGLAIYHGLLLALRENQIRTVTAVLDERVRRLLSSVGLVMHTFPGTRTAPYLGSEGSTPVYAHVAAAVDDQRRRLPDAHRLVTMGVGLGITVPEPGAFRRAVREPARAALASSAVGHLG